MGAHIFAACLFVAAQNYMVPPAVLLGIMQVEGGQVGVQVGPNTNGSYDLGVMQINTLWVDELAKHWKVSKSTAKKWIKDDGCTNISVAAWILRQKINQTGSLSKGIAYYHSATPHLGSAYRRKVINAMNRMDLLPYKRSSRTSSITGKSPG